jgi:hypothetical protein
MATEPTKDAVVEQKLQKLRELYADAPEVGKVALQNGMADIAREFAALTGATECKVPAGSALVKAKSRS